MAFGTEKTRLTTQLTAWGIIGFAFGAIYGAYQFSKLIGTIGVGCAAGSAFAYAAAGLIAGLLAGTLVTLIYNVFVEIKNPEIIEKELKKSTDIERRKLAKELKTQKKLNEAQKELSELRRQGDSNQSRLKAAREEAQKLAEAQKEADDSIARRKERIKRSDEVLKNLENDRIQKEKDVEAQRDRERRRDSERRRSAQLKQSRKTLFSED